MVTVGGGVYLGARVEGAVGGVEDFRRCVESFADPHFAVCGWGLVVDENGSARVFGGEVLCGWVDRGKYGEWSNSICFHEQG